jgi:uncharacterized protein YdcH (DUF465 family)
MTRTSQIVEDVANYYNHLLTQHKKLHDEIEHCQYYAPDSDLKHLKQRKLKLKDELEMLKTKLKIFTDQ